MLKLEELHQEVWEAWEVCHQVVSQEDSQEQEELVSQDKVDKDKTQLLMM
jgi:hypothetical protein